MNIRQRIQTRLTYANIVASIALFAALGGSSYAAITVSGKNIRNNTVSGADIKNNSVTSRDVRNRSLLANDFKPGQLPSAGQGPAGPRGATGLQGAPATSLFALVASDGTVTSENGVTSATSSGGGQYSVTFDSDVSQCAAITAPGATNGAFAGNRISSANRGAGAPRVINVQTQRYNNPPGDFLDENTAFNLAVFC